MVIKKSQQGVTLIEMIVVVAIFAVVASVLFFNYSNFSTSVSLRTLSQEIALATRKAQTYGTSVRSIDGASTTTDIYPAYGVSFSAATPDGGSYTANNKQFVIFADAITGADINRYYDNAGTCGSPSQSNECLESFSISSSDKIISLCTDYPSPDTCTSSGTVNVVFRRPSPDAEICVVSGGTCATSLASYVKIVLQSAKGDQKTVTIWNTGQISGQ